MKNFPWYLSAVLFSLLLLQQHCTNANKFAQNANKFAQGAIVLTEYVYDTVEVEVPVPVPVPADSVFVEVPADVDTAAILRKHFTTYYYHQEITDSNLTAWISDSVAQNNITHRSFSYKLHRPVAINHTYQLPPPRIYAGMFLASGKQIQEIGYGPEITIAGKRSYRIAYDVGREEVQVGVGLSIK